MTSSASYPADRDHRHPERLEQLAAPLDRAVEVRLQLVVELLAGGLVLGIALLAKRAARVVHPGDVVGAVLLLEPEQEVGHAPRGGGVLPPRGPERPGDHGEEGAVEERVAVDEEEPGRMWWGIGAR